MKLHDYCERLSKTPHCYTAIPDHYHYASMIHLPLNEAMIDRADRVLKLTQDEFRALLVRFDLPWDWDGKHIWGLELKITE